MIVLCLIMVIVVQLVLYLSHGSGGNVLRLWYRGLRIELSFMSML